MSEGIDEPLFYTDALGNIMVKYKGLSFHPKAYHSLMSMPTAREQELEKENEELKERLESTCEQRLVYEQDAEKYHDEAVKYKKVIKLLTEHYNCRHIWG